MKSAWDELAATIKKALESDYSVAHLHWPDYCNRKMTITVEWNGGLPIIDLANHETLEHEFDITACKCRDAMEAVI